MKDIVERFSKKTSNPVTIKDVAAKANVSVSTVSNVVNKTKYVSPHIVEQVERAIKELGYRPNPAAKILRKGKSKLVGFVVSNLENSFYVRIAKGIEKVLNQSGYNLLLMDSAENVDVEKHNIKSLYLRGLDGLIIAPTSPSCAYINEVIPPTYPLVFVDRAPTNIYSDTILLSNSSASMKAVDYLINTGRKRIAFVGLHFGGNKIDNTMNERLDGYKISLGKNSIPIDENLICVTQGTPFAMSELQYSEAYHMTENLLKEKTDAILCGNDLAAIGVFTCLKERGIKIPSEISLITFDDGLWLKTATPSISTIVQPAENIGLLAGERLLKRLNGEMLSPEVFRLNATLVIRESS